MATAKQYEILFLLKAQMDAAFGTGFNSVRTYLTELQGKARDYNNTLRDISAYRRVMSAEEELKRKIAAKGTATTQQNDALQRYKRRLDELRNGLRQAGVDTDHLTDEENRLRAEMDAVQREMEEFVALKNRVTDLANAFFVIKPVADTIYNGVKQIDKAIYDCIQGAGELQYTMSAVRAVSGATEEETRRLTETAKYMGATTVYTASEAAGALQTMALAGWSTEEMLAGLPAVIHMAAASGEDLTEVTSIVSDAMHAWGVQGEKEARKFSDVLVKSATSSNTTVGLLGQSLGYVETTAANLNYSIEDVGVALAVMANNALKGSVSGSALNTMLTRMSGANKTAKQEMEALGLSMYDDEGHAKDLMTFMNELRTSFKGFGDNAQAAQIAAYKLAGQRGMRALLAITNTSDEAWQQMTEDIYAYQGAAEEVANTRLDNYRGQIYLLDSAFDALKTTVGEEFLPAGTGVAEVLTDLCNVANDFVGANQDMLVPLSAGVTAFGAVAGAVGGLGSVLMFAKTAMDMFMPGMLGLAGGLLGVGAIAGLVVGGLTAFYTYRTSLDFATESYRNLKEESEAAAKSIEESANKYQESVNAYDEKRKRVNALIDTLDDLRNAEQNAWTKSQIQDIVGKLNSSEFGIKINYDVETGTIDKSTDELRAQANQKTSEEIERDVSAYNEKLADRKKLLNDIKIADQAYREARSKENAYNNGDIEWDLDGWREAHANAEDALQAVQNYHDELIVVNDELASMKGVVAGDEVIQIAQAAQQAKTEMEALEQAVSNVTDATQKALEGQVDLLHKAGELDEVSADQMTKNLDSQIKQFSDYKQNLDAIFKAAGEQGIDLSPIVDDLTSGTSDAMAKAKGLADSLKSGSTDGLQAVVDKANEAQATIASISDSVGGNFERMYKAGDEQATGIVDGIVQTLTSSQGQVTQAGYEMGNAAIEGSADGTGVHSPSIYTIQHGAGVVQGLTKGIADNEPAAVARARLLGTNTVNALRQAMPQSSFYAISSNAVQGAVNGLANKQGALTAAAARLGRAAKSAYERAMGSLKAPKTTGFAGGTKSAPPGMAWVGENGPELMAFRGGEQVYTNSESMALEREHQARMAAASRASAMVQPVRAETAAGSKTTSNVIELSFAPVIHAEGTGTEGIRAQLQSYEGHLISLINEAIDEREAQLERRAY